MKDEEVRKTAEWYKQELLNVIAERDTESRRASRAERRADSYAVIIEELGNTIMELRSC